MRPVVRMSEVVRSSPSDSGGARSEQDDDESRKTVLFPAGQTFPSSSAFFSASKARLLERYGYTMHINQNDAHRLVARCAAYPRASECRMHVVAVKKGGRWVVDHLNPRWEHDHDPGLDATHDSEGEEEDEDDEEDEDAERDASSACGEDSPGTPETASSSVAVPQLPMPGLPAPGDSFDSHEAFEAAVVRAVTPVYGFGVHPNGRSAQSARFRCNSKHSSPDACGFKLAGRKDARTGRWIVDAAACHFAHNHGARPEILADPSWRPKVYSAVARAALGLPPADYKRNKQAAEAAKKRKASELDHVGTAVRRDEQSLASTSASDATSTAVSANHRQLGALAVSPSTIAALPPPSLPGLSSYTYSPSPVNSASRDAGPPGPSFLPYLSAFLSALHPSLAPLAAPLLVAGVDSLDALVRLTFLDESMLAQLLTAMRERDQGVSVIQVKLLARLLGERARGGGER